MIKVLISDDHVIFREGLKGLLLTCPGIEVVGEAWDGEQVVAAVNALKPDVVLLDIVMPGMSGIEAAKKIKEFHPEVKILMLTQYNSQEHFSAAFHAGADGYILKDATAEELFSAIKQIYQGNVYLSPNTTGEVIRQIFRDGEAGKTRDGLSPRESEVVRLLAEGLSSREVAQKLSISRKTVQTHLAHIMKKLSLKSRTELVKYAIRKGIVAI